MHAYGFSVKQFPIVKIERKSYESWANNFVINYRHRNIDIVEEIDSRLAVLEGLQDISYARAVNDDVPF